MKLNREWHLAHHMPERATPEQRYAWHLEHEQNCTCRAMSPEQRQKLQQQVEARRTRGEAQRAT